MRFSGSTSIATAPLPMIPQNAEKSLPQFFSSKDNLGLLLSTSKGNVRFIESLTDQQINLWASESIAGGGSDIDPAKFGKDPSYRAAEIVTEAHFFGMKLSIGALMGIKMVLRQGFNDRSSSTFFPEYQLVQIGQELTAHGFPPLVWLFNKIMNGSKVDLSSFNSIRAEPVYGREEVVFKTDAAVELRINVPSKLVPFMRLSKEKAEEQGCASMEKSLIREVKPTMQQLENAYLEWISAGTLKSDLNSENHLNSCQTQHSETEQCTRPRY